MRYKKMMDFFLDKNNRIKMDKTSSSSSSEQLKQNDNYSLLLWEISNTIIKMEVHNKEVVDRLKEDIEKLKKANKELVIINERLMVNQQIMNDSIINVIEGYHKILNDIASDVYRK